MKLNSPQINLMTKACMKASRSLIRDFGEIENLQVSKKGPRDFVTNSDLKVEKIIIDELKIHFPSYKIINDKIDDNIKLTKNELKLQDMVNKYLNIIN